MRYLLIILILFFDNKSVHSQIKLKYVFIDECDKSIKKLRFNAYSYSTSHLFYSDSSLITVDLPGAYSINVNLMRGDQYVMFSASKMISMQSSYIDTIRIPKLLGRINALESSEMYYTYCDTIADGYYIDYYYNGKVRLKGTFRNGCPEDINFYNIEGKLCRREFYKNCISNYIRDFKKQKQVEN